MSGKRPLRWSTRLTLVENRTGEVEEEQRSLFETGPDDADCGEEGRSSKKDLLPHTTADIVQNLPSALQNCSRFQLTFLPNSVLNRFGFKSIRFQHCSWIDDRRVVKSEGLGFWSRSRVCSREEDSKFFLRRDAFPSFPWNGGFGLFLFIVANGDWELTWWQC